LHLQASLSEENLFPLRSAKPFSLAMQKNQAVLIGFMDTEKLK
jgi:hypothetical protein